LNVPIDVTVTIAVLDSVVLIVRELGDTERLKSGGIAITFRVTMTHAFLGGDEVSLPVTFKV
jgi:hypothetical protein